MTTAGLIYVVLSRATCGLVVDHGRIADAPPYLRRTTLGKDAREVWRDLARQAHHIDWLPDRR
jgi:hypothetical protein